MAEASEEMQKVFCRRMARKTGLVLGAVCLALFLICFLPFLFSNNGSAQTVSTAIVLTAASVGLMALVLIVALFIMRVSVLNAVNGYNDIAKETIGDINLSMKRVSKY
jgi:RsiW-degrading membrane proteinase PrsW (M82 family)